MHGYFLLLVFRVVVFVWVACAVISNYYNHCDKLCFYWVACAVISDYYYYYELFSRVACAVISHYYDYYK